MKKRLTIGALLALGGISTFAGEYPKKLTGIVTKKNATKFSIETNSGEVAKFNVWKGWKKTYKQINNIVEAGKEVTITIKMNKKNEPILGKVHN